MAGTAASCLIRNRSWTATIRSRMLCVRERERARERERENQFLTLSGALSLSLSLVATMRHSCTCCRPAEECEFGRAVASVGGGVRRLPGKLKLMRIVAVGAGAISATTARRRERTLDPKPQTSFPYRQNATRHASSGWWWRPSCSSLPVAKSKTCKHAPFEN